MATQTPKQTSGMRLIRSHNTVHNRRRLARSMFANRFFLAVTAVLAIVFVFQGMRFYQNEKNLGLPSANPDSEITESVSGDEPISEVPTQDPNASVSYGSGSGAGSSPSAAVPSAPAQSSSGSACGNPQMPSGVCTAIQSIESEGIKKSKYVVVDTSQMPEGTSVKFNNSSWASSGSDAGAVSGDLVYSGQPYKVSVTFAVQNSQWVATGYSAQ